MDTNEMSMPLQNSTKTGQFLARRGQLMMREFREFGSVKGNDGGRLVVSTVIISLIKETVGEKTFGVKIVLRKRDSYRETCLLDFDELRELLLAIKYMLQLAVETSKTKGDYTEFQYVSKDELQIGYCQDQHGLQNPFVGLHGATMPIEFERMRQFFELVKQAREHLIEKGGDSAM